jgi:hypothetical protein
MTTDTIRNIDALIGIKELPDRDADGQFTFKRIGTPANEINLIMEKAHRQLIEEFNLRVEYALRFLIAHPIKGEITKGKLKRRGIKQKILEPDDGSVFDNAHFIGRTMTMRITCEMKYVLIQRGKVIDLNFPPDVMERYLQWKQANTASMKADYQFLLTI